ncbi:hypothetical protein C8N47_101279 [Mangrovibacterium marinum]|uniref:Uncharacterized protein n=1 Tax=Mangrovibacterium marinum TaxID=1639118 RepID=A0A2T5C6Q1_9BACT|nr:hypothetical protein C8N47_101279 [Mangrovibacterium marinum]
MIPEGISNWEESVVVFDQAVVSSYRVVVVLRSYRVVILKRHQQKRRCSDQCQKVGNRLAWFYRVFTFENAIKKRNSVMFLKRPKPNEKLPAIP